MSDCCCLVENDHKDINGETTGCCPGWGHFGAENEPGSGPHEIMRCDDCHIYDCVNGVLGDTEAVHKHRIDCGCNWPERRCRGVGGWSGGMRCGHPMVEIEPFYWACVMVDCLHKEDERPYLPGGAKYEEQRAAGSAQPSSGSPRDAG